MNNQFKKIKIFMILTFLIFSSLFLICPSGKAGPLDKLYECYPIIEVDFNETLLESYIIPYGEATKIPIKIKIKVGGPTADIVVGKIKGLDLIVDLSIADVSEGAHASVNPPMVQVKPSVDFNTVNATISVTVDQNLPAFSLENIKLGLKSKRIGAARTLVKSINISQDIPFFVGYLPQLSFSYKNSNVKNIGPDQTADFIVEMQNWGNADSKVNSVIEDLPEGWQATIVENTTLGTILSGGAPVTIRIKVKPPINFGYHEDRAIIKLKMTPVYYNDSSFKGEPHYLNFIVQSNGFSTPGFETFTILLAFSLVIFSIWRRKLKMGGSKK